MFHNTKKKYFPISVIILVLLLFLCILSSCSNLGNFTKKREMSDYIGLDSGTNWKGYSSGTLNYEVKELDTGEYGAKIIFNDNNFSANNLIFPDFIKIDGYDAPIKIISIHNINNTKISGDIQFPFFLSNIDSTTSISNKDFLPSILFHFGNELIEIGNNFLAECLSPQIIFTAGFSSVTTIRNNFLRNCENIQSIDLSPFINVTNIGDNFMRANGSISDFVSLKNFGKLISIGTYFLADNNFSYFYSRGISTKNPGLINVQSVGDNFLDKCVNLLKIDVFAMIKMKNDIAFSQQLSDLNEALKGQCEIIYWI